MHYRRRRWAPGPVEARRRRRRRGRGDPQVELVGVHVGVRLPLAPPGLRPVLDHLARGRHAPRHAALERLEADRPVALDREDEAVDATALLVDLDDVSGRDRGQSHGPRRYPRGRSATWSGCHPGPRNSTASPRAQPARGLQVVPQRAVLVEGDVQRPARREVLRQAVADALALLDPRPEQAVPDDQDAAVVAVEVDVVRAVVDAVMARRVERPLDGPRQPADALGVQAELVDEAPALGEQDHPRARSPAAAAPARTGSRSSAPTSGAARSRGCSAARSGGRRGWPRRSGSRARRGGTSSRRGRRGRTAAPRPTTRRPGCAAG